MLKIRTLFFCLTFLILSSCSLKQRKMVFLIRNHNSVTTTMPVRVDDPSDSVLKLRKKQSLMVVDGNGFTIPYQKVDSSKIIFLLNIKGAESKKYTFKATDHKMVFDSKVRYFVDSLTGDVFWENDRVLFRMHSSKTQGQGGGIDCICKAPGEFRSVDSILRTINDIDFYNESNSLGCGGIAPVENDHLLRYGNFLKMEVIDSGPVLLRMRFTFPEFSLGDDLVYEQRTVSIVPGLNFSKIESRFFGIDSLALAVGMPYKDIAGNNVDSVKMNNVFYPPCFKDLGIISYGSNGTKSESGTIFTSVGVDEAKHLLRNTDIDNHMVVRYTPARQNCGYVDCTYYQGYSSSLLGCNYEMWKQTTRTFMAQLKEKHTIISYDSE